MQFRTLGRSGLQVSVLCLGTNPWGARNTEAEAHQQLEAAVAGGINFFDTAEMYPAPVARETWGRSEEILGSWLASRKDRDKLIVATKAIGPGTDYPYVRGGRTQLDRTNIEQALDDSLRRLRTDYIDLYQLHWPDRRVTRDGASGFEQPADGDVVSLEETLGVLDALVRAGKVRYVGVSNETPWGVMTYLGHAEAQGGPRMVSIQNRYNLIEREFEPELAEVAIREDCGLLAYVPLCGGLLTGKYLEGARPSDARFTLQGMPAPYRTPRAQAAVKAYVDLARTHGLEPGHLALAFVLSRRFLTSVIVAATSVPQLEHNVAAVDLVLPPEVNDGIAMIHRNDPRPCG